MNIIGIKALNSIEIEDFSYSGGECDYVLAEITARNIEILLDAGFTTKEIDEAMGDDVGYILCANRTTKPKRQLGYLKQLRSQIKGV